MEQQWIVSKTKKKSKTKTKKQKQPDEQDSEFLSHNNGMINNTTAVKYTR